MTSALSSLSDIIVQTNFSIPECVDVRAFPEIGNRVLCRHEFLGMFLFLALCVKYFRVETEFSVNSLGLKSHS